MNLSSTTASLEIGEAFCVFFFFFFSIVYCKTPSLDFSESIVLLETKFHAQKNFSRRNNSDVSPARGRLMIGEGAAGPALITDLINAEKPLRQC